jgi:predicted Fe-Mo cluster-binding NifX family protein
VRICIPSSGKEVNSSIDSRFGRCSYFVIVDSENMETTAFCNPAISAAGGAGIQAAQEIVNHGANVLLAGNIGPNSHQVLSAAEIDVFEINGSTVEEAVKKYLAGGLEKLSGPNTPSHAGMGKGNGKGRQNGKQHTKRE